MSQQQENQRDHEQAENLRVLLEQHWAHCRHLESERAWFMNAYAVVIGGVSAFLIGKGLQELQTIETSPLFYFLVVFLIMFTLFGFFHTLRWTHAFECHREKVNSLAKHIGSKSAETEMPEIDLTMNIPAMELPLPSLPELWKFLRRLSKFQQTCNELLKKLRKFREVFRTRYWFPALYFFALCLFAYIFPFPLKWWAIGCLLIALWLGTGFLRSKAR